MTEAIGVDHDSEVADARGAFGAAATIRVRGEAVRLCGDAELGHWLLGRLADTPVPAPRARRWLACVREDVSQPGGTPESYAEAESGATAADAAWLPLVWEPGALLIGPLGVPGTPGCPRCAWLRRHRHLVRAPAHDGPYRPAPPSGTVLEMVAALLADELSTRSVPRTRGTLVRVGTGRGEITRHPVLPDPECPHCGPLLPGAEPNPVPRPAPVGEPGRLRMLSGAETAAVADSFVDPCAGLVHEVRERAEGGRPVAVAVRDPAYENAVSYHGYGHGEDFRSARSAAVLEALERLGGVPVPDARALRGPSATYREVAGNAVHPPSFGLHSDASYGLPDFPYVRWSASLETDWAWGRSLTRNRAVLVPAALVHYADPHPRRPRFVQESSSGCAVGASLTEAVLHGLLEVAERDAFLAAWYARLPLTRIDLEAAADRRVPMLAAWARERAGCELMAFDATLEQGVPAVWVMSVAGHEAVGPPAVVCGAAARLRTEDALVAALDELVCTLLAPPAHDLERAAAMLRDPFRVRTMSDHELLYAHPSARERLAFLRTEGERVAPGALDTARPWPESSDLAAHVAELVARYAADGMEVVVVDQTRPEHRAGGLRCVKVLVPGTLPMTFGHAERRLECLPRVRTLPRTLGFRADALAENEINPHPHPFP
ncbi:TOMM precursor leader peptide-binding protein [Streptomyces iconiensis]|uniref:TOMM leader peptide-binding protein n=1 Tax=Streptomyces iconiensis TaxID=1384038 RepID=A0ABT6ZPQ4_9ACTN|nr:TOMM precursor leader peptide-binding protein [Streptomyces iconiensis]MDJ1131026.1 TOMM precursor leader peptide-binding protein [Streptomyces iconiensis]